MQVPSDAPAFLLALGAHVAAGLTCVVSGAVAAVARKTGRVHARAGLIYWAGLTWILISSITMAVLRWPYDIHLLAIGGFAFVAETGGVFSRWWRWYPEHSFHIVMMGLPAALGVPLIVRSLRRWATPSRKDGLRH